MALVLDLCALTPTDVSIDVVGASISGGRSLPGTTQSIGISGGGLVAVTYGAIVLMTRAQHLYWNEVAAVLNGSVDYIDVPLWTDFTAGLSTDPAGSLAAAGLHAASLGLTRTPAPEAGQWFAIHHSDAGPGWRAYRIKSVGAIAGGVYPIEITPPLREAIAATAPAVFWRPKCRMKLADGEQMAWSWTAPGVISQDRSVNLVEHF